MQTPTASLTAAGGAAVSTAAAAAATSATAATAAATSTVAAATTTPAVSSAAGGILSSLVDSVAHAAPLLGSLGVFTMVIALHEAGHLVAALSQGIRVKSFSIGFGPKLLSYRGLGSGEKEAATATAAPGSKQGKRGAPSATGGSSAGGVDGRGGGMFSRLSGPSWDWGGGNRRREDDGELDAGNKTSGGRSVGRNAGGNRLAKSTGGRPGSQKNAAVMAEDDVDDGVEVSFVDVSDWTTFFFFFHPRLMSVKYFSRSQLPPDWFERIQDVDIQW